MNPLFKNYTIFNKFYSKLCQTLNCIENVGFYVQLLPRKQRHFISSEIIQTLESQSINHKKLMKPLLLLIIIGTRSTSQGARLCWKVTQYTRGH